MIQDVQRITQPAPPKQVHPALLLALQSDLAKALKVGIAGAVVTGASGVALGWESTNIGKAILAVVAVAFFLFVLKDLWYVLAANLEGVAAFLEALAEVVTRRDLNHSGAIGDVKQVTHTEYRVIPSNIKSNGVPVQMGEDTVTIGVPDLKIVVLDGDLMRAHWLGEKDAKPVDPFKNKQNARQYYDAIMKLLDNSQLTVRGSNNSRRLVHSPTVSWSMLQLE